MNVPTPLTAALEQMINRLLALDPEGAARLSTLSGKILRLEWRGLGLGVVLIPTDQGIQVFSNYEAPPDCTLRGTPLAFSRLGLAGRKEDVLFSGQIEIEGDPGLAQAFADFLGDLEIDWEELLARFTGDTLAHPVGEAVRGLDRWMRRTGEILAEDLKEMLQEEARLLPTAYEVEGFLDAVDQLREDAERLEARVKRLRQHLAASSG